MTLFYYCKYHLLYLWRLSISSVYVSHRTLSFEFFLAFLFISHDGQLSFFLHFLTIICKAKIISANKLNITFTKKCLVHVVHTGWISISIISLLLIIIIALRGSPSYFIIKSCIWWNFFCFLIKLMLILVQFKRHCLYLRDSTSEIFFVCCIYSNNSIFFVLYINL